MTPPLPPDGYELVEDEPREGDMAWFCDEWYEVDTNGNVWGIWIPARYLRWIARKK